MRPEPRRPPPRGFALAEPSFPPEPFVVLVDAPGAARSALARVLRTLLGARVDARPHEATQQLTQALDYLQSVSGRADAVVVAAAAPVADAASSSPATGLAVLKGVVRRDLYRLPLLLLGRLPERPAAPGPAPWVPEKAFLEAAGFEATPSAARLADVLAALGRLLAAGRGEGARRREAFQGARGRLREDDERDYEAHAHVLRHRYVNCVAAARLLFGAFALGDVKPAAFEKALEFFRGQEEGAAAVSGADLGRLRRLGADLLRHAPAVRLPEQVARRGKVLVVDDQWGPAGWCAFFRALFGDTVSHAADRDAALAQVEPGGPGLAVVFLDLCLPDDPEQGLGLLRAIKRAHLDLPVLIFSGVDQIRYARRGLSQGAANYYVKELVGADRASVAYYRAFAELVLDSLAEPETRELWRRLRRLAQCRPARYERECRAAVRDLRRAYYFFTTEENNPRARLLFEEEGGKGANVFAQCCVECRKAVELLVNTLYEHFGGPARPPGSEAQQWVTFRDKVKFAKKQRDASGNPILPGELAGVALDVWSQASGFAHSDQDDERAAADVFRKAVDFAERVLPNLP